MGPVPGVLDDPEELEEAEEPEDPEDPGVLGELGPRDGPLPDELGLLGPPGPLALPLDAPLPLTLDDGELCGVLGVLTGLVGVPEGVPLGDEDDGEDGVEGVVGPLDGDVLGVLLGPPPEPPTPLIETIWPLGSKRTCAVHAPLGSAEASTRTWIVVWPPPASMPEVALRLSQGWSGLAVQLSGEVPEFQRVTTTSLGSFERCVTLMCSCPSPLGSWVGPSLLCDGSGFTGPLNGRLAPGVPGTEEEGVVGSTAATTCAVTVSPGSPVACTLPATGSAGPAASEVELGRG